MIYKPEHVVDLESGAIVTAQVRAGDAADSAGAATRLLEAVGTLVEAAPQAPIEELGAETGGGEGYFALAEIGPLQSYGIEAVFADPHAGRRRQDLPAADQQVLARARQAVQSERGKALLRQRGQHVERAFCHLLDHGGLRRATLRGEANLSKRYLMGAFTFNLSLLLRTLFGLGTPKQWLAASKRAGAAFWRAVAAGLPLFLAAVRPSLHALGRDQCRNGVAMDRMSIRGITRTFGVCYQTVIRWVGEKKEALPAFTDTLLPGQEGDVLELDELWSFVGGKACQLWLWVALCRRTRQVRGLSARRIGAHRGQPVGQNDEKGGLAAAMMLAST